MERWTFVFGTRPEWLKIRPVIREFRRRGMEFEVWHTGQHTELLRLTAGEEPEDISGAYRALALDPDPDPFAFSVRVAAYVREHLKSHVVVQGDTSSAYGAALGGAQAGRIVAHIEAGIRSRRPEPWPEEAFRIMIDQLATYRFAPTTHTIQNLDKEGLTGLLTGNTIVDDLLYSGIQPVPNPDPLVLITLHRRETHGKLKEIAKAISRAAKRFPNHTFLWPVHPNPAVQSAAKWAKGVKLVPPMDHCQFRVHLAKAQIVLTDSGGVQEEAATLGTPCLVARDHTDRPENLGSTARLLTTRPHTIEYRLHEQISFHQLPRSPQLTYGSGTAATQITQALITAPTNPPKPRQIALRQLDLLTAARITRNLQIRGKNEVKLKIVKKR